MKLLQQSFEIRKWLGYLIRDQLFIEEKNDWKFDGYFQVDKIENEFVILLRINQNEKTEKIISDNLDEFIFQEGSVKYVTHLKRERNPNVVSYIKEHTAWTCDICNIKYHDKYGVDYIEAHHKTPVSDNLDKYDIRVSDLVLLCPNCHKAVHIYMKKENLEYDEIKLKIQEIFN